MKLEEYLKRKSPDQLASILRNLIKKVRKLEEESLVDPLTHAYNRRKFRQDIQAELKRAKRNRDNLSLLMIDIDKFKQYNDTYGHQAGDNLLKQLTESARQVIRNYDTIYRYGGEEFAILVPETRTQEAFQIGERLRERAETLGVTISMGISDSQDSENITDLVEHADKALYQAKERGRNRVEVYRE